MLKFRNWQSARLAKTPDNGHPDAGGIYHIML